MRIHIASILLVAACTSGHSGSDIKLPPMPTNPNGGTVPGGAFMFGQGAFHFTGSTVPGNASFVGATLAPDPSMPPPSLGTGTYNITLNGTTYTSNLQSESVVLDDGTGTSFLAVAGFNEYTGTDGQDHVDEVVVITLESDFAVGANVALDGNDRIALFGTGLATSNQPDAMAAATTGSVTFSAGSLGTGGSVDASVTGDFGPVNWGGGGGGTGTITDGTYTLAIGSGSQVYCDGSLAGHEADFASITAASLSLGGGSVTMTTLTSGAVNADGAPIAAGYGATPLELDDNGGLLAGFSNDSNPGPDSTTEIGKYFVIDPSSATTTSIQAGVGAGYATADGSGTCTVAFDASLTM